MHDAGSGCREPPLGGLEAGKGERARKKETKETVCVCVCVCVCVEDRCDADALGTGTVLARGHCCMFRECGKEKKQTSLSFCPCNIHQLFQTGGGKRHW